MNRKHIAALCILVTIIPYLQGCASILGEKSSDVLVTTNPSDALVSIKTSRGREVFRGSSPANARLKKKRGFFKPEDYTVTASKDGFYDKSLSLDTGVSWWYAGNILVGGLIGWLLVDPATGAMWTVEEEPPMLILEPKG